MLNFEGSDFEECQQESVFHVRIDDVASPVTVQVGL